MSIVDPVEEELNLAVKEDQDVVSPQVVPEKFQGKSLEDVIHSYSELESELGRKAQEVGELRKLSDTLLQKELDAIEKSKHEEQVEIDETDFFDDPASSVRKIIKQELDPIKEKVSTIDKQEALSKIKEAHSDYEKIVGDTDFQEWVNSSPIRRELWTRADANMDYNSANELFGGWKDKKAVNRDRAEELATNREENLARATLETGGTGESSKKIYRRQDLIRLRINDPEKYNSMQQEIMTAYNEGRVK